MICCECPSWPAHWTVNSLPAYHELSNPPHTATGVEMHYNRIARHATRASVTVGIGGVFAVLLCTAFTPTPVYGQAKPSASAPSPTQRRTFVKPSDDELKKKLTPLQYAVTQRE